VPRQQAESEIVDYFRAAGQKNATGYASFLGAGAYRHYRPVIIDSLVQRGEFLTSYTPYQAEITQGTLQAIFEFQTMIAELTGMDVANASMYDGSTGAAEAVMMAVRVTGRHKAVVPRRCIPNTARCWPPTRNIRACRRRSLATTRNRPRRSGRAGSCGHRRNRGGAGAEPQLLRRD
jgi:glycine cleavage system pyridoxal-binding protein P